MFISTVITTLLFLGTRFLITNFGIRFFKLAFARIYVWILQRKRKPVFDYNYYSKDLAKFGITSLPEARINESPRLLQPNIHAYDQLGFCGVNKDGTILVTRLTRRPNRVIETWVYLRLPSGEEYQLPNHPDTKIFNTNDNSFSAGGLTYELLEPLRAWRVCFNGHLRRGIQSEWNNNDDNEVQVKFSFIWHPIYSYVAFPDDFQAAFLTKQLTECKWPKEFMSPYKFFSDDFVEQHGELHGILSIENENDQEIFLRGLRRRSHGILDWKSLNNRLSISATLSNGTSFHIFGEKNNEGPLKRYLYGYIWSPCGMSILHIDKFSLNADLLFSYRKFPKNLTITMTSGKNEYVLDIHYNDDGFIVREGNEWNKEIEVHPINIKLNGKEGLGVLEYASPYFRGNPVPARDSLPLLKEPDIKNCKSLVLQFDEMECRSSNVVGGKGASLANMANLPYKFVNFSVPPGVCLTKAAFKLYLRQNHKIEAAILEMQNVAWKRTPGTLQEACDAVVITIADTAIPKEVENALKVKLLSTFGDDYETMKFAVRSSAIGEDGEEMSAAGQNETFLGVKGLNEILSSVLKCWASQFAFRSVEYKRQNGQLLNAGMGVVIQKMVPAEVAGVLFTRDPLTGSRGTMTISSNFGLGESVVSAMADPDAITLRRSWNDNLSILKKEIGSKKVMVSMSDEGGTTEKEVDSETASKCTLSDEMAIKLGKIAIFLEQCFGNARDNEWAVYEDEIYLLQSRPVTIENPMSDFEIMHEFDTATRTDEEHFSTANVGEVLPGSASPLSLTGTMRIMPIYLQVNLTWKVKYHRFDPTSKDGFANFYGHFFTDRVQQKVWAMNDKKNSMAKAMEIGIYGRLLDDSLLTIKARERFPYPPFTAQFQMLGFSVKGILGGNVILNKSIKKYQDHPIPTKDVYTIQEAYRRLGNEMLTIIPVFETHLIETTASIMWTVMLFNALSYGCDDYTLDHYSDFARLVGTANGAESGDVPFSLNELAETISKDVQPEKFISWSPEDALNWLQESSTASSKKYANFIKRHGHRGIKEFDMIAVTWGLKPTELVKVLQDLLQKESCAKNYSRNKVSTNVLDSISTPMTGIRRKLLSWAMAGSRRGICQRERAKSLLIQMYHCMRLGYRRLAEMMVEEGLLPDPNLIFFLTHEEIGTFINTRSASMLRRAKQRQRVYAQTDQMKFPELIDGYPTPNDENSADFETVDTITGYPVSQGKVQGPARVVASFHEISTIKPGEILITYATDIGWSPYFPMLAGVVTEIGGLVSHGAVVAREFGLPCIVGAVNATRIFKSGDTVLLDANKGILSKIQ